MSTQDFEEHNKYYRTIALLYFTLGAGVGALLTLLFFNP